MSESGPPEPPWEQASEPWRIELGPLPARQRADRAPRSGQPWTDAEYEEILAAVREGVSDMAEIAARIGRDISPTMAKARRLLPLAERSAPVDRVFRLLREHQEDPDYDWRRTTLAEPPPRPVIQPPALTGITGLPAEDLVAIGYAVGLAAASIGEDLVGRVGQELYRRGLVRRLLEYRADRLVQRAEIGWERAVAEAGTWVARTFAAAWDGADGWYAEEYALPTYW